LRSSNSGLEASADGLRILGGCTTNEVLSWDDTSKLWACSSVSGVGGVTGTGVNGQVSYWTGTSTQTGSNNFWWDNAQGRLGIGTSTPLYTLDVNGDVRIASGSDLLIGTIGIGDTQPTGAAEPIHYTYDEFAYSNATNVQGY
jgi:hypothetical protein